MHCSGQHMLIRIWYHPYAPTVHWHPTQRGKPFHGFTIQTKPQHVAPNPVQIPNIKRIPPPGHSRNGFAVAFPFDAPR
jgi:hypothetical protein